MWTTWQETVKNALPNFCADKVYSDQEGIPAEEFCRVAAEVREMPPTDLSGRTRDAKFGARLVDTPAMGSVTRMYLDSCVEIDFLRRNLFSRVGSDLKVLDVGSGYGRLAVSLAPMVHSIVCVDPVSISVDLCRWYLRTFPRGALATSIGIDEFAEEAPELKIDLAVNVHSWSECSTSQTARWVETLAGMGVPWLFTVVHGNRQEGTDYLTWWGGRESFRPAIEAHYEVVVEEHVGLMRCPHALWRLKP